MATQLLVSPEFQPLLGRLLSAVDEVLEDWYCCDGLVDDDSDSPISDDLLSDLQIAIGAVRTALEPGELVEDVPDNLPPTPLADEIGRLIHAFNSFGGKHRIRTLARRVAELERRACA